MTAMILPTKQKLYAGQDVAALLQVSVYVQTTVMAPDKAQHKANVWLSMNAGNLLLAENPELVLNDHILWRFDVFRTLHRRNQAGVPVRNFAARMQLDAMTGAVLNPETLIKELIANADALVVNPA